MNDTATPEPKAAVRHMDALPVGTRLAEFEILGLIGVGGFGIVYKAFDHSLHRAVAIKEYLPGALVARTDDGSVQVRSSSDETTFEAGLRSFVDEARMLAQFDHPSLVKVFRFWEAHNTAYMVMPLYRGMTLKQARSQMRTPPSEEWMRQVLWSVLSALQVLHEADTLHRDISPDNIFLQDVGPPVLLDLGASRHAINDRDQKHTAVLKVNYAPIEQYTDADSPGATALPQGPWSDLYSLGAVVHGCLCNDSPLPATLRSIRDRMVPFSRVARTVRKQFEIEYSAPFVEAITQALKIQPEDRPQTIGAFIASMALVRPPLGLEHFDFRVELGDNWVEPTDQPDAVATVTTVDLTGERPSKPPAITDLLLPTVPLEVPVGGNDDHDSAPTPLPALEPEHHAETAAAPAAAPITPSASAPATPPLVGALPPSPPPPPPPPAAAPEAPDSEGPDTVFLERDSVLREHRSAHHGTHKAGDDGGPSTLQLESEWSRSTGHRAARSGSRLWLGVLVVLVLVVGAVAMGLRGNKSATAPQSPAVAVQPTAVPPATVTELKAAPGPPQAAASETQVTTLPAQPEPAASTPAAVVVPEPASEPASAPAPGPAAVAPTQTSTPAFVSSKDPRAASKQAARVRKAAPPPETPVVVPAPAPVVQAPEPVFVPPPRKPAPPAPLCSEGNTIEQGMCMRDQCSLPANAQRADCEAFRRAIAPLQRNRFAN